MNCISTNINQPVEDQVPIDPYNFGTSFFRSRTIAAILISVATYLVYNPGIETRFILDSVYCIENNPTIQDLSTPEGLKVVLETLQNGCTTQGRPFLNLSFAINYEISGNDPYYYQVTNLVIHILVALTLYGLL